MTDHSDNIHPFPGSRRARSANDLRRATPEMAMALLTACLALVRPAGMTDHEVEDWLRVAAQTVGDYPPRVLDAACMEARRSCTHFSQIVPAIVAAAEPEMAVLRRMAEWGVPQLAAPPPPRRSSTHSGFV